MDYYYSLLWKAISVLCLGLLSSSVTSVNAQALFNQEEVAELLNRRAETLDAIPNAYYNYYVFSGEKSGNTIVARHRFYKKIGGGDIKLGQKRSRLVELLNRKLMRNVEIGDTLIVPTKFGLDMRAYSPFPRYYPGGREYDKLFIMDKKVQAFAAYERGKLARWGVINTGDPEKTETPNGRYSFHWKQEYRVSTLSPPGEEWEMYWVVNFYHARGMHVHQYPFPTGGPASHGCVRLIDADAKWVYNWAEPWSTTQGHIGPQSAQGRILAPGTPVLVIGDEPAGFPQPFTLKERYPVLERVDLPEDPYDIPAGSPLQERLDRKFPRLPQKVTAVQKAK